MPYNLLQKYESFKPFTEAEAWGLFRLAAIAEACGWTLLISGILLKRFALHGNDIPVQLAGHTHGILFLIYCVAVIVLYPSQGWSRRRTIIAGLASIPPYGSLAFEQWAAHKRRRQVMQRHTSLNVYRLLLNHI